MTVNTNICDSILHECVRRVRDHLNCESFSSGGSESKPFVGIFWRTWAQKRFREIFLGQVWVQGNF